MAKRSKAKKLVEKANDNIGKIAGIISGLIAIIGALTGTVGWLNMQLKDAIAIQVNDLKTSMQDSDNQQNQQITRLELLTLINNQPENVAEIEKVAKHYFQNLSGNWYMTSLYSKWCQEYGGDPTIVIGEK